MPNGLPVKLLLLVIIGAGLGAVAQTMLSPGQAPEVVFRQANATPLPSGNESSAADGAVSRETESPAGPPEGAGPATESPE